MDVDEFLSVDGPGPEFAALRQIGQRRTGSGSRERGWVNYFAVGHSSECFGHIKDWVEKKVRRHLAHAQKRRGFGWKRWSKPWLYDTLKLFNGYRVQYGGPKVAPAR